MTFREVLQVEIWSKQTSRKIWKVVGVCTAVGVVVAGLELQWVTPSERVAAKVALADVEDLQQKAAANEDEYKKRKEETDEAVERTQKATWTLRDKKIANALYAYSILIEMQHDEPKYRTALHEFQEKHPARVRMQSDRDQEVQQDQMSWQVNAVMHEVLHRALD